ncbi:small toxic polypeptide [Salmonella enterica subsp. enterica serovar Kasenyi]|nr:small toxic polypeptide [Salmonella enterica subsp. enterica serovar Kasenyi]
MQGGVNHETTGKRPYRCVLIVCCTLLIFTLLTRNRLCEVRLKDGYREITASMAYESGGK